MKINLIKDRLKKVPDRAEALWKKYPVLTVAIVLVGIFAGFWVGYVIGS